MTTFCGLTKPIESIQVNRAIRYVPYMWSRTAGAPGDLPAKGGQRAGRKSEPHQRRKAVWQAAGHKAYTGIMILALAMRHSVGRPATRMGGGTYILWSGPASRRLVLPLIN